MFEFYTLMKPSLEYKIYELSDPYGPSIVDPMLGCIVVSEETKKGGDAVNEKRKEKYLSTLQILVVDCIDSYSINPSQSSVDKKLSSTHFRAIEAKKFEDRDK